MHQQDSISVTILSPDSIVWSGRVLSLSSSNGEGNFDIIPDHARFMTLLRKVPLVVHELDGSDASFTFDTAVLFFQDNVAKIYTHQAL